MTEVSLRDVFGDFLVTEGAKNPEFVVIDADLSSSTRISKFAQEFPERFFNMGIAEQNAMGTAIGFAISGKIPIVSGFSIFTSGRAWEFIRLICHDNLNVKIVVTHAGFVGEDGSTHHALEDLSIMSILPNLNILVPVDGIELNQMLKYALRNERPFYIRLPRAKFPKVHNEEYKFELGGCDIIKDGNDICMIGTGYGTVLANKYAERLEKTLKTSIKILNLSTIKPIYPNKLLNHLEKIKGIIVIEEHNSFCGVGALIARVLSEKKPTPIRYLGVDDSFGRSGSRDALLEKYGFDFHNLKNLVQSLLN